MTPDLFAALALACAAPTVRTAYDLVPASAGPSAAPHRQETRPSEQGYAVSLIALMARLSRQLGACQAPRFGVGPLVVRPKREVRT